MHNKPLQDSGKNVKFIDNIEFMINEVIYGVYIQHRVFIGCSK